jgi:hypothetical protein
MRKPFGTPKAKYIFGHRDEQMNYKRSFALLCQMLMNTWRIRWIRYYSVWCVQNKLTECTPYKLCVFMCESQTRERFNASRPHQRAN